MPDAHEPAGERGPVVVVGHAARDVVEDDPRGWRLGGSATYVSYSVARLGVAVRAVVGVDAEAAESAEIGLLEDAGVEVHRVAVASGPIFENVETATGRRQRCLSVGRSLTVTDVPVGWRGAPAWALVPVLGEVSGASWAGLPDAGALVVLGWQGMLRAAEAGGPTVKLPPFADRLIERADVVVVGTDDLLGGLGEGAATTWENDAAADPLGGLLPRPGQQLAITAGARGGRLFERTSIGWTAQPYEAAEARVIDWTGAGDVFLAAYLASAVDRSLAGDALTDRLTFAATVAAMSIEGPGITTTPTRDEVRARLRASGG